MKIYLATDHAGFELKEHLKGFLASLGHEVEDCGAHEYNPEDDYPDFVKKAAEAIQKDGFSSRVIVLGGSGQGEAIVANKVQGVRAAVYYGGNIDIVRLCREHNDANILSIGARFISVVEVEEAVKLWLDTAFSGKDRHVRRISKVDSL